MSLFALQVLQGNGYQLALEANSNGYGNMSAIDNRFSGTGYGAGSETRVARR